MCKVLKRVTGKELGKPFIMLLFLNIIFIINPVIIIY